MDINQIIFNIFSFALIIVAIIIAVFLIAFLVLRDSASVYEFFEGEVLVGDKKRVKDKTAVYITCDTYMTLHAANPVDYPIIKNRFNSDELFEKLRDRHSIVFKPLEARKLRKIIDKMEQNKQLAEDEKIRRKRQEKARADIEKMLTTVQDYSDKKNQELNKALDDNMEKMEKMIKNFAKDFHADDDGIPIGGV